MIQRDIRYRPGVVAWVVAAVTLPPAVVSLIVLMVNATPEVLTATLVMLLSVLATAVAVGQTISARLKSLYQRMALEDASTRELIRTEGMPTELANLVSVVNETRQASTALSDIRRDLFSNLSHQIKSPLSMVAARAGELPAEQRDFILATIQSIARLVDQMMVLALAESQSGESAFKDINPSDVVHIAAAERVPAAQLRGLDFVIEAADGLRVRGHASLLNELLVNLIDNAIKYAPHGSRVWVRAFAVEGRAVFEVEDEGCGVPRGELAKVFSPFYGAIGADSSGRIIFGNRQNRTDWRNSGKGGASTRGDAAIAASHGLGLAIVKSIATAHKGDARLISPSPHEGRMGAGTIARISMPMSGRRASADVDTLEDIAYTI